jgi:hypothetical protein
LNFCADTIQTVDSFATLLPGVVFGPALAECQQVTDLVLNEPTDF